MKHFLLACMLFLFVAPLSSQVEFGIKGGLSSYDLADDFQLWRDADSEIQDVIVDANYGYHFGIYTRIKLPIIYIEPAILFNSNKVSYNFNEPGNDGLLDNLKEEKYQNIDIPLLFGAKLWFLRVHAGPVAHIFLNSSSELTDIKGYKEKFKDARYGFQTGVGIDLGKLRFDVNYEGNFSSFGESVSIGGTEISFDDRAARIVASVGYRF